MNRRTTTIPPLTTTDPKLDELLRVAQRALGVHLCYHDRLNETPRLESRWKIHGVACCMEMKKTHLRECMAYDLGDVHRSLSGKPEGEVHTCPFGVTEVAVPVLHDGAFAGVLFAGPFWCGRGNPSYMGMVRCVRRSSLKGKLVLLRGVALQVGELLSKPEANAGPSRRTRILRFLHDRMKDPVYLAEAARHLSLSPSRARHVIREMFGSTFRALVRTVKLTESTFLLRTSDLSIGEIADRIGYPDQNYFTRSFTRQFKLTPRAYRRHHSTAP